MIRVAYFCIDPGVPVFGSKGASVHVQEILRSWRALGAEVTLYCTRTGDDVPADLADVPVVVHRIPKGNGVERERFQTDAAAALAQQAIAAGTTVVYERYSLFSDALARVTAALGIPGFLEVNAPLIDEQRTHRALHDETAARHALRSQVAGATRVACVSAPVARWVQDRVLPEHREKVQVVPNGVNVERIRPTPESGGMPVVVFVGTLKPWHGVDSLIEAKAVSAGGWALRIIGDGPEGPALRRLAADRGVAVEFVGALPPAEVPAALAGCALASAPYPASASSEDQYFSPLKIYEYCAAGLPVIASDVGQVPSIIDHGVTGILVEPSRPDALAAAIDDLTGAPLARAAMSVAARRMATAGHSWDGVLQRITAGIPLEGTP
ncbi:glycosyltransferase family 4 protein [Arthrobacter sp. H41]|uniref:glycosyltransferase family 4 protein n=1 Tax=Arthrobacter sp. H41 TaxID=1312978 RepID=UPI0004B55F2A|nr:glycosyltransferase family 4 protein [Arthrobacter sp. H41]